MNIELKPTPLALAGLLCASSVWMPVAWAAVDLEKDKINTPQLAVNNPSVRAPASTISVNSDTRPVSAKTETPINSFIIARHDPSVTLPTLTIKGRGTPLARQTDKDRYHLPQTTESITRGKMETSINMMQTEDAIKYLPSVQVRNRYIGDTNAPIGTRTSGTSASARNLIYADGILLSSLLGNNNGNTGSPRWNTVAPGEIERIDIMYGPFAAAYPGNSMGGVINITTRMPEKFIAGADVQHSFQTFDLYGTKDTYHNQRYSGYIGHKYKDLSMRFDYSHLDAHSQPISFATALNSTTVAGGADTVVTGAIADASPVGAANKVLGAGNINHTVQDNFKWKLAYDFTPTIRLAYTLGMWQNNASAIAQSYLRDAAGNIVDSGNVNIDGRRYNLSTSNAPTFAGNQVDQTTWSHGLNLRSNTGGKFDWELVGSLVDLSRDSVRAPTVIPSLAATGGAGRNTSLAGSGWYTFDARGIWRPGVNLLGLGYHEISFGVHHSQYTLNNPVFNTGNWQAGNATSLFTNSVGKTRTEGYWLQDAWDFNQKWNFTYGGRFENWHAYDGANTSTPASGAGLQTVNQTDKSAFNFSPKGKLTWSPIERVKFGAAIGQAYRYATASELFQTSITGSGASAVLHTGNPNLRPEDAVSSELSAEYFPDKGRLRLSLFQERVKNAIFSQLTLVNGVASTAISNVGEIHTYGIEFSGEKTDFGIKGLDVMGNFTWADSRIIQNTLNDSLSSSDVDTTGKRQPRVPMWRSSTIVTYRATDKLNGSVMTRYSSQQFGRLDNTDLHGGSYTGLTNYFVVDLRANYRVTPKITISAGIDNVNNEKYWVFHPMPQRTFFTQVRFVH